MTTIYLTILSHVIIEPLYYTFWEVHHGARLYNISGNPFVKQTKKTNQFEQFFKSNPQNNFFHNIKATQIWKWFSFLALTHLLQPM
jgi:ABC-type maltose transport system permease subunit